MTSIGPYSEKTNLSYMYDKVDLRGPLPQKKDFPSSLAWVISMTPNLVITKPLNKPIAAPTAIPIIIANVTLPVYAKTNTTIVPTNPCTEPIERSIPPAITQIATPTAAIALYEPCLNTFKKLVIVKKWGDNTPKIIHVIASIINIVNSSLLIILFPILRNISPPFILKPIRHYNNYMKFL